MNMNKEKSTMKNLVEEVGVFKRGAKYLATVTAVRKEGVAVAMPGGQGCAMVSACCWGKGERRDAALAKLREGDELKVVVKSYDRHARNLSLVLVGCEHLLRGVAKPSGKKPPKIWKKDPVEKAGSRELAAMPMDKPAKSNYRLIPDGATMLVDTANVLGAMGPQHAAHRLSAIERSLSERGHEMVFFIENRTLGWLRYNQDTPEEVDALEAFCSKSNVSKVGGEADLPILQAACVFPDSVILTRDHYEEYSETFPEVVGSERLCNCSSVMVGGKTLLSIVGLRDAIVIDDIQNPAPATAADAEEEVAVVPTEIEVAADAEELVEEPVTRALPSFAVRTMRKGLLGVGDACREKGDFTRALTCYGRIARKDPAAYYDMADIYSDNRSGLSDARVALKYQRLGQKNERKFRQCRLRCARLRAEGRRTGHHIRGLMRAA